MKCIIYVYTYISSVLNLPPTPQIHQSRLSQNAELSSLCCLFNSRLCIYVSATFSIVPPSSSLPVSTSPFILYVCISIPTLQVGS